MERSYPYKGWILMPSFKPVEVEFVEQYTSFGNDYGDRTEKGKVYRRDEIFAGKQLALNGGHLRLEKHRAQIAKLQLGHDKKLAALKKAEQ
jgi:hypothetical protein